MILVIALLYMISGPQVMTPYCGALLDCHMPFFRGQISLISYCNHNGVKLAGATLFIYLPPHSTHPLQPLDVGLFSPLQQYYRKAARKLFSYYLSWHQLDYFLSYL